MKLLFILTFTLLISSVTAKVVDRDISPSIIEGHETVLENSLEWERAGFKNTLSKELNLSVLNASGLLGGSYTHSFDLDFIKLRGTSWSEDLIKTNLIKTAQIYAQCNIKLNKVRIFETEHDDIPSNYLYMYGDSNRVITNREAHFAKLVPTQTRPLVFLFEYLKEKGLYDYNGNRMNYTGHAYIEDFMSSTRVKDVPHEIVGSILLSYDINTKEYLNGRSKEYNTLAHEIGHVLGNQGHTTNLMSEYVAKLNGKIDSVLCEKFRHSPYVKVIQ